MRNREPNAAQSKKINIKNLKVSPDQVLEFL